MNKTQKEKEKIYKRMIHLVENQLIIKDKDGNQVKVKLNKIQKAIMKYILDKNMKNLQIVSDKRYRI